MTAPGCPVCGAVLVAVGLVASKITVYTCPTCHAWYDVSLRAIAPPF
jgi:hypothetical protein